MHWVCGNESCAGTMSLLFPQRVGMGISICFSVTVLLLINVVLGHIVGHNMGHVIDISIYID